MILLLPTKYLYQVGEIIRYLHVFIWRKKHW